ncbi:hypothetical protein DPEC_G00306450 [Dallia pectoralis]|uniref:Uncharacterized protein n=1 Tax=Dallia pectoralis TaxID=75939 RepID=A0ACC2FE44_DALPE|nr:hypothetical protein DPEC_G00306450 [Dallia pectoralis]
MPASLPGRPGANTQRPPLYSCCDIITSPGLLRGVSDIGNVAVPHWRHAKLHGGEHKCTGRHENRAHSLHLRLPPVDVANARRISETAHLRSRGKTHFFRSPKATDRDRDNANDGVRVRADPFVFSRTNTRPRKSMVNIQTRQEPASLMYCCHGNSKEGQSGLSPLSMQSLPVPPLCSVRASTPPTRISIYLAEYGTDWG